MPFETNRPLLGFRKNAGLRHFAEQEAASAPCCTVYDAQWHVPHSRDKMNCTDFFEYKCTLPPIPTLVEIKSLPLILLRPPFFFILFYVEEFSALLFLS